jgi:hypothetical protein
MSRTFFTFMVCMVLLFAVPLNISLSRDVAPLENPETAIEKQTNSCFVSAILFKETFDRYNIWSRIVKVLFKVPSEHDNHIYGHVFVEYIYPKNSTNLWLYDNTGSWKVDYSLKDNPVELAKKIFEDNGEDFAIDKANFFGDN